MRTINRSRVSNYELVYSTSRNAGSRDGNAGNRPARNNGGSRRGGAGADSEGAGYGSRNNGFFGNQRPGAYAPSESIKEKGDLGKRGEDIRKSGDDKGGESN